MFGVNGLLPESDSYNNNNNNNNSFYSLVEIVEFVSLIGRPLLVAFSRGLNGSLAEPS